MFKLALLIVLKIYKLSISQLAVLAQVSRQSGSLWFTQGGDFVDMRSSSLISIAKSLKIPVDAIVSAPQSLQSAQALAPLEVALNWDKQFPSVIDLIVNGENGDLKAIARLVQSRGLFETANLFGVQVWEKFDQYKKFIQPLRRKQCEELWKLQHDLALI